LSDADLSAPTPRHYAEFPADGSVTVPFDPHESLVVDASINGVTGRFAVDPLVRGFYIDPVFAQKIGLIDNSRPARYVDQSAFISAPIETIQIGALTLRDVKVGIWGSALDTDVSQCDGLLGLDLLSQATTTISFDARTITFTDPDMFSPDPKALALPMTLDDGQAEVLAMMDGTQPLALRLAYGLRAGIALWPGTIDRHPSLQSKKQTVQTLTFANLTIDEPMPYYPFSYYTAFHDETAEGWLGAQVLYHFNAALDYTHQKLYLTHANYSL